MRIKLIRLGSLITLYNGIYAMIYGALLIIFNEVILSEYFIKTSVRWDIFAKSFPYRAKLYSSLLLTHAFFLISLGVFIIYLSYFILKKKDKLAWVVLFSAGIISWASLFIINVMMGSWIIRVSSFIGWVSFAIGMVIPLKYYIQKGMPDFK